MIHNTVFPTFKPSTNVMRYLLLFALVLLSCSKDDGADLMNCDCEQATLGYTLNGEYNEFIRFTCVSFWTESGYQIENGIIMGPMEEQYNDAHNNFYRCN